MGTQRGDPVNKSDPNGHATYGGGGNGGPTWDDDDDDDDDWDLDFYYDPADRLNKIKLFDPWPSGGLDGLANFMGMAWIDAISRTTVRSGDYSYHKTQAVEASGESAQQKGASYEASVRALYGARDEGRDFEVFLDGYWRRGRADATIELNGRRVPIEAKYALSWGKSIRNPNGPIGAEPWAAGEQNKMIDQARTYSTAFGGAVYHTNSIGLADHYRAAFDQAGIKGIVFVITPTIVYP